MVGEAGTSGPSTNALASELLSVKKGPPARLRSLFWKDGSVTNARASK